MGSRLVFCLNNLSHRYPYEFRTKLGMNLFLVTFSKKQKTRCDPLAIAGILKDFFKDIIAVSNVFENKTNVISGSILVNKIILGGYWFSVIVPIIQSYIRVFNEKNYINWRSPHR